MWKAFYEGNELLGLPLVALLVFVFTFAFVVLRVTTRRKGQAVLDQHLAGLPLEGDEEVASPHLSSPPLSSPHFSSPNSASPHLSSPQLAFDGARHE